MKDILYSYDNGYLYVWNEDCTRTDISDIPSEDLMLITADNGYEQFYAELAHMRCNDTQFYSGNREITYEEDCMYSEKLAVDGSNVRLSPLVHDSLIELPTDITGVLDMTNAGSRTLFFMHKGDRVINGIKVTKGMMVTISHAGGTGSLLIKTSMEQLSKLQSLMVEAPNVVFEIDELNKCGQVILSDRVQFNSIRVTEHLGYDTFDLMDISDIKTWAVSLEHHKYINILEFLHKKTQAGGSIRLMDENGDLYTEFESLILEYYAGDDANWKENRGNCILSVERQAGYYNPSETVHGIIDTGVYMYSVDVLVNSISFFVI